jgi:hypothetical protein
MLSFTAIEYEAGWMFPQLIVQEMEGERNAAAC